jgi:ABC-type multidrug transport system, ATPase component
MIEIKNLDFGYKRNPVFKNINLSFEKGNIYGLLGQNGVGKTTLLKLISGLQKPTSGSCKIDGIDTYKRLPESLQNIYFISEDFAIPTGTPEKHIKEIGVFYPRYDLNFFYDLCKDMEVDPTKKFLEMSFGQQKKALIATALSLRTDFLLLDEPTNGLDIPSKTLFRQVISKFSTDNTTIIISTHQVKDVENLIDPIVILDNDDVLLKATFEEITEKLYFDFSTEKEENALYSEMFPGGFINISKNVNAFESKVNIEALFNAVLKNKETIKELFNNSGR